MLTKEQFDKHWKDWADGAPKVDRFLITQDPWELWTFCEFLKDYKTYLEIGGAWGHSIWFAAHAMNANYIATIDLCESHSGPFLASVVSKLNEAICPSLLYTGNSNDLVDSVKEEYEILFIDGKHDYNQVKRDYENYGKKATKAIVFHDFCQPGPHQLLTEIGVDRVWYSNPDNGFGYAVKFK